MTVAVELRLADEDRAKYGGPEWLPLDWKVFDDLTTEELDAFEGPMDMSIHVAKLALSLSRAKGIKAALWLARQTSGDPALKTPGWGNFVIHPRKFDSRKVADANPPVQESPTTSPEPSSGDSPKDDESETSSDS